jgi:CSLREA domain-containing protein
MKRIVLLALWTLVPSVLLLVSATAQAAPVSTQAAPTTTIVVTTVSDAIANDGHCSLREAIQTANTNSALGGCAAGTTSSGGDTIEFAIPGNGPHTIRLKSALPEITGQLRINGLSQSGAVCVSNIPSLRLQRSAEVAATALMVELDGSGAGASSGLVFGDGSEFSAVEGLIINRFAKHGIHIRVSADFFGVGVFCNWIGTDASGASPLGNGANGIYVHSSPGNSIQSNVIAGNEEWGILIEGIGARDNRVEDNSIGTNAGGSDMGNGRGGILAQNSGPQVIGGTYTSVGCCLGNTIAHNGGPGVAVSAALNVSLEKGIRANRIYANDALGIDLEIDGVTPNDLGDADGESSANGLQNFPVIDAASVFSGVVTITGTLNSTAGGRFQLDLFANDVCDPSGYGEGQRFLGVKPVTTDADGNVSFTATFAGAAASLIRGGDLVTATASDPGGNTSEFSKCVRATGPGGNRRFLPLLRR